MYNSRYYRECKRILIINLGGIGDSVLSVPALKALDYLYPQAKIVLLSVPRAAEVIKDLPYIDELVVFNLQKQLNIYEKLRQSISFFTLLLSLRKRRFDMAINMRTLHSPISALKMAVIFLILKAKYRVGRNTQGWGFFLNISIPERLVGDLHEIDYNLRLIELLGGEIRDDRLEIKINKDDIDYIKEFLKENQINDNELVVGINPGSDWPSRRWPLENFAETINGLLKRHNCKIVITGSKKEIGISQSLKSLALSDKIIVASGKFTVKQFAGLVKRFNLFITNDTGSMHIATIHEIPMVVIFGPGDINRFKPRYSEKDKLIILQKTVECAPCNRVECKSVKCLKMISPEEVLEACYNLLEKVKNK